MLRFVVYEDGSGQLYLLKSDSFGTLFLGCYDHVAGMDVLHDTVCQFGDEFSENLFLDEDFVDFQDLDTSTFADVVEWLVSVGNLVADDEGMYVGDMNSGARDEFCGVKLAFWLSLYNVLDVARL